MTLTTNAPPDDNDIDIDANLVLPKIFELGFLRTRPRDVQRALSAASFFHQAPRSDWLRNEIAAAFLRAHDNLAHFLPHLQAMGPTESKEESLMDTLRRVMLLPKGSGSAGSESFEADNFENKSDSDSDSSSDWTRCVFKGLREPGRSGVSVLLFALRNSVGY